MGTAASEARRVASAMGVGCRIGFARQIYLVGLKPADKIEKKYLERKLKFAIGVANIFLCVLSETNSSPPPI